MSSRSRSVGTSVKQPLPGTTPACAPGPASEALRAREKAVIPPANRAEPTICWERGAGTRIWDVDGHEYLDFTSGVLITAAGHSHPAIAEAIAAQATQLVNCYASPTALRVQLAERLLDLVGEPFDRVGFVTTGSEAIDAAAKIARFATGRTGILTFGGGFHGRTLGGVSFAGLSEMRRGLGTPIGDVVRAPYPYPYRWPFGQPVDGTALELARWAIESVGPDRVGAILLEPFLGAGGVVSAPAAFLRGIRQLADEVGAVLILDEIQSGLGRCGRMFAFHESGLVPDVVVAAKGLGGGLPIIAVVSKRDLFDLLPPGSMTSTFGGNPLSCAAALATLDVIESERLVEHAARVSAVMVDAMRGWPHELRLVGEVRAAGLSFGIELVRDGETKEPADLEAFAVSSEVSNHGLVILPPAGLHGNVVRFAPPLSIPVDEALEGLRRLRTAIEVVGREAAADHDRGSRP